MAPFLMRSLSLRACSVVASVASLFAGGAAQADRLLTFEDAVTVFAQGYVAFDSSLDGTGYAGFAWSNAIAYQRHPTSMNGYTVCVGASAKGAYSSFAQPITISRPGRWILHDFACTAAWNTNLSVRITGTRSGVVVYDRTEVLGAPIARTTLNLNFANIDSVTITPSGGTDYGYGGGGSHLAIDDMRWSFDSNANGIDDDIESAQRVVCWGANNFGQCNVPADPGPVIAVEGGGYFTIALRTDGAVRCWGDNLWGQCSVPADLGPAIAVAAGAAHAIAVRMDGMVRCWGENLWGQCSVPADLGPVTAVAGGWSHTIALRTDGVVRCWGLNDFGQCDVPADLGPARAIAGGYSHTFAARMNGTVRCWGLNDFGQCNVPADLGPVTAGAAGESHTIALRTDGVVRCWGRNELGQCDVPADLGPARAVAGGWSHTIALRMDGTVRCWGAPFLGQCDVPADLGPVTAIAAGDSHTIALRSAADPVTVSLASAAPSVMEGDTFTVRASCTTPDAPLSGVQLAMHFDATRLRLDAVEPVGTSALAFEIIEQVNNAAGTLRYALGLTDPAEPLSVSANLCDLTFTVLPGADLCGAANLVTFGDVGGFTTRVTRFDNAAAVVPALVNLPPVNIDATPPVLSGVPVANITVATDAGSTVGALVSLPTVTAVDACEGEVAVTVTGAIASGLYPIGTTTVTWSAVDSLGNTVFVSRDIVVANYQLLDARISLYGVLAANATRSIRVTAGASVGVHSVTVPSGFGGVGTITGIQVPVASSYSCVSAKDTVHTLTRTAAASIVGARYEASFALVQGDSNNDDLIEIVDYAIWVIDVGPGKPPDARSNFNADFLVNNADLAPLSLSFFTVGDSCTGALAGARPRERVSVRELRRMGLGELASADLNRDGWFDMRDIHIAVQGGGGPVESSTPHSATTTPRW